MIDVFGSGPVSGNPLAVVHDAEGLSTDEMQAITRWLNLSETTFLLPATTSAESEASNLRGVLPDARPIVQCGQGTNAWIVKDYLFVRSAYYTI